MFATSRLMFESSDNEHFSKDRFAWTTSKSKGKEHQTSYQPKKPKFTSSLSSFSDSIESIQAEPSLRSNPYTKEYFQDSQDPYQLMISNDLTNFLSRSRQVPTITLASENLEQLSASEPSNNQISISSTEETT